MEFSKAYLDAFLKEKPTSTIRMSDVVLRKVLLDNQESLGEALLKHYTSSDMTEVDLKFVLETFQGSDREIYINKIFDIALMKQKFTYSKDYKKLLMHHFAKRKTPVFKRYLDRALDPTSPLFLIDEDDGKYIAKRIASGKIKISTQQANFLLSKIRTVKTNVEAHYLLFLRVVDYLSDFTEVGYQVFEEKFNQLIGGRNWPIKDSTCIEILHVCRDSALRARLAKEFLKHPYGTPALKKRLAKNFPEIQRLLNME